MNKTNSDYDFQRFINKIEDQVAYDQMCPDQDLRYDYPDEVCTGGFDDGGCECIECCPELYVIEGDEDDE